MSIAKSAKFFLGYNLKVKIGRKQILILLISLIWILFIFGGYYYFHKPINLQTISTPLTAALNLILGLFVVCFAGGIGRKIFSAQSLPPLERAALQSALGAGVLGLFWLVLGAVGLFFVWLAWLVLLVGSFLLRKEIRGWLSDISSIVKSWQAANQLEKFLAIIVSILFLQQLLLALAPPLKWDALTYHLQLPRLYITAGNIHYIPENPYWGFPQIAEMLFTFANLLLNTSVTGAVTCWGFGIVFFIGVLGFTNTHLARIKQIEVGTNAGWMAVAVLMAGVTIRNQLGWSYTDLFAALFGLAVLITLFEWLDTDKLSWFRWACLFAGLAISVKWTAGVMLLGVILGLLLSRKSVRERLKMSFQGGLIALVPVVPWLIKNAVVTGNPLFPYFFSSPNFSVERISIANRFLQTFPWWQRIFLPFSITFTGVDSAAGFSTDPGPLLLLLGLPGLVIFWRERKTRWLAIILLPAFLAIGLFSLRFGDLFQPRLYFVVLAAVAILAGWGWFSLQSQTISGVRLRRLFGTMVALVMLFALFQDSQTLAQNSSLQVLLGGSSTQSYLEKGLGTYYFAMQRIEQLPATSKTLMLWEPRGLYAPLNAQPDLWIDRWITDRREQQTPDRILAQWKSQGFTHILVYLKGEELIHSLSDSSPSQDWTVYQQVISKLSFMEEIAGWYRLYSIP